MKIALAVVALATLTACQGMNMPWNAPSASANLQPTKGSKVSGKATFRQIGDKVRVSGQVDGLTPGREHGFHIHEAGDCSSGDGMSAKGHFNPEGKPHGHPASRERHAGDMPMLRADASGNASISADLDIITVAPGPNSIVGRGLIVHVQPDDYKTQPTGNAGARSACGVIRAG
jgi:Cu-Zn family superoxide dismutase